MLWFGLDSVNRCWFMVLAPIPLNHSFTAARRDSRRAPAHWGDAKIEFLTECIQQRGGKKGCWLSAQGLGWAYSGGDPAAKCVLLSPLFQVISFKSVQGF